MTEPVPAPSPDRALRALADAVGESRPRMPEDASDPGIPVAATVLLLRDSPGGPEVLLIERPDRGSFAGAWVFPGGKVDPPDRLAEDEAEEDVARRAGARETREEVGLVVDQDALVTVSCWDPPPGVPLRIRTWFFAVRAPEGLVALAADEAVTAEWVRPSDMLARHGGGDMTLYPPTWVTLAGLADAGDVESVLSAARLAGVRSFETQARKGPNGPVLMWREDAEHDLADHEPAAPGHTGEDEASARRHRLEVGSLPWIYTRSGW